MDDKKFENIVNLTLNFTNILTAAGATMMGEVMTAFVGGMGDMMNNVLGGAVPSKKEDIKGAIKKIKDSFPKDAKEEVKRNIESTEKFLWPAVRKYRKEIEKILTDDFCNECISIIDKYDFNLPKLTEKLDEDSFMGYLALGLAENEKLGHLLDELMPCYDKHGDVMSRFSYYLPGLITNLDTGKVRTEPSKADLEAEGK